MSTLSERTAKKQSIQLEEFMNKKHVSCVTYSHTISFFKVTLDCNAKMQRNDERPRPAN